MRQLWCVFWWIVLFLDSFVNADCSSSSVDSSYLLSLEQYQIGTAGDSYYNHFLSQNTVNFTYSNVSAEQTGAIGGLGISAANSECSASCLTSVSAYYQNNGTNVSIIMLRPDDTTLYPNYTLLSNLTTFYCVNVSGYCGATTALYQYQSSVYYDYLADTSAPSNGSYTVTMTGLPLCYLWTSNTTTTTGTTTMASTTTTTSMNSSTTTTVASNTTTTTSNTTATTTAASSSSNSSTTTSATTTTKASSSNSTATTVTGATTTTTTATPSNATTAASSSNTVTTAASSSGGSGGGNNTDTSSSSSNDSSSSSWWHNWRWPIIAVACLVCLGVAFAAVAFITCAFIGAASSSVAPKSYTPPPAYDSPGPPELPPQPVQTPTITPFTVGM